MMKKNKTFSNNKKHSGVWDILYSIKVTFSMFDVKNILTTFSIFLLINNSLICQSPDEQKFSVGGFYQLTDSGRGTYNFNIGWRFFKGVVQGAEQMEFNDSSWSIVNTPHGLELNSAETSGSNNYQGEAWYRKHFDIPSSIEKKKLSIYFEAVMGKCKVWLNGKLIATHFGGFLPFSVDLTEHIKKGQENILAVWADNSDDAFYPPGKPQKTLDFSYFGGIYRDVWLIATNPVYITNANTEDKIAGGGVFVHFENVSKKEAAIAVAVDIANSGNNKVTATVQYILKDKEGSGILKKEEIISVPGHNSVVSESKLHVKAPKLWTPSNPYLYHLEIRILKKNGNTIDGIKQRVGIRTIEFRGKDGFYLNGEPYKGKLMGANRHQDHAYVGNALPNSGQWRDAKILKEAGSDIVRAAHYPADPAFMDACDELGLFFIEATPGWQFWNKDPIFEKRVYQDIRNMVRRDRNRPSVIMWEPILNETWYPPHFAEKTHNIVHQEYPFQGAYTVCDVHAKGQEYFDVVYSHPFINDFYNVPHKSTKENNAKLQIKYSKEDRSIFTREWGDCVDNWNSHNSPSRVSRGWGEHAQLVQVEHYANPPYVYTSWESLYNTPRQHVGGTLWHSFDHQRGYHPDPFYGGITDVFRQPKYSYYLFKSQRNIEESEPMVYITNEMTPFSEPDVTVFTNCDEVRLIVYEKDTLIQKANKNNLAMPHPIVTFKNIFDFMDVKKLHRAKEAKKASIVAEGLIEGKVVVRYKKMPTLRPTKIKLELANYDVPLIANGSDFVTVIASITDDSGNIKRLNNSTIHFEVEGEGEIIDNGKILANPRRVAWGTAPVLVRSTTTAGLITVKASLVDEGVNRLTSDEITFKSKESNVLFIFKDLPKSEVKTIPISNTNQKSTNKKEIEILKDKINTLEKTINKLKLKEIEKQQSEFEGSNKN